jgi:hypothetical protein
MSKTKALIEGSFTCYHLTPTQPHPIDLVFLGKSVLVDFWVEIGKVSSLGAGLGLRSNFWAYYP